MAERNYLVEGLSGSGKSSVYEELIRRGYKAVSTDRAWKRHGESVWDEGRAQAELERREPDVLFVCGSSRNRDRFLPYFATIFNLRIDDDTMRRRLAERTNNDYGKAPDELEHELELNRRGAKPAGAVDVDATRALGEVVDELLRSAGCETSGSWRPAWSAPGGCGASFVTASGARLDFGWSAGVLVALLRYLGIDSVALTAEDRRRYESRLDPTAYDVAALQHWYEQLNGSPADGVGYALLDGVAFLRDALALLEPGSSGVLDLG